MRILVVDDHEIVRKGICSVLATEPSIDLCGEASDGQDAVAKARSLVPDIVVMDISLPNMNGLEATREIRRILPHTEVLVLSQHDTPEMVRQAFKAGARGYVVKSAISSDLLAAIAKISRREVFLNERSISNSTPGLDAKEVLQRSAAFEKALRESEELFRSTMNSMAEGLYTVDPGGRVTYANPAAENLLGWSAHQLLGKKMHDLTQYKRPDGSVFPAESSSILQVLRTGTELREHEDVFVRKDGTFFPVVLNASPMKVDGLVAGVVVSFRDDTKRLRAEDALLHSEGIFRAIGETMDYGIWISDQNGRNIYASASFLQLLGVSQEQVNSLDWSKILHPDEAQETMEAWNKCVREGNTWEREYRCLGADKKWHYILARGGPIRDARGNILYWAGIHLDIQQRKESEIALRRNTSQFQLVTDTMAVAVTRCSRDLRYLWVNSLYASWMGRSAEEIIGRSMLEVLGPETFEKLRSHMGRVLEGQPVHFQEQIHFHGLGRRWISAAYSPTFDSSGRADGWVGSIIDITDRRRKEAELAKQARLLDLSFNAVLLRDAEDRISYWNKGAEELYGWTSDEACGHRPYDLLQTVFPEPLESILQKVRRGESWQGELIHTRKNGSRLTVLSRWALTRDPETNSDSITEINIDITQTKEAESQLHLLVQTLETRILERTRDLENATFKLRELSGRLLQTQDEERRRIARELHDGVGQLLAALKMNVSKISRDKSGFTSDSRLSLEESASLIDQASQEIRTMSHLLHPPLLDEVGLESALRWYVDGFAERSKIAVNLEIEPGFSESLPRELALTLFRIVQESLTNVHRHSGSSTAAVFIRRGVGDITLEVRDEGSGIPAETQVRIASGESSGVGLRGMRERIRQFGGTLNLVSDSQSTRVIAVLPVHLDVEAVKVPSSVVDLHPETPVSEPEQPATSLAPEPPPSPAALDRDVSTILCIDDEPSGLLPRRLLLESAGHRVLEARSGEEGIRLFTTEKVDVVILDYWMAGMKGTTVASALKRINPAIPIIVLSGMTDLPGEAAGLVDQWLVKGSHRAEYLLDSISTLLERRPL